MYVVDVNMVHAEAFTGGYVEATAHSKNKVTRYFKTNPRGFNYVPIHHQVTVDLTALSESGFELFAEFFVFALLDVFYVVQSPSFGSKRFK